MEWDIEDIFMTVMTLLEIDKISALNYTWGVDAPLKKYT